MAWTWLEPQAMTRSFSSGPETKTIIDVISVFSLSFAIRITRIRIVIIPNTSTVTIVSTATTDAAAARAKTTIIASSH